MTSVCKIVFICALFQVPLIWCLPVPESDKAETDIPAVENEPTAAESTSPTDVGLPVPDGNGFRAAGPSIDNIFSEAALASLLQMIQSSMMSSFPSDGSGFARMHSGEVKETILGPGTRLRVMHRTLDPATFRSLTLGPNEKQVLQKQVFGTEKFSARQSEFGKKEEDSPDVLEVEAPDVKEVEVPKEAMDDLEEFRNNIEKLNEVME